MQSCQRCKQSQFEPVTTKILAHCQQLSVSCPCPASPLLHYLKYLIHVDKKILSFFLCCILLMSLVSWQAGFTTSFIQLISVEQCCSFSSVRGSGVTPLDWSVDTGLHSWSSGDHSTGVLPAGPACPASSPAVATDQVWSMVTTRHIQDIQP